MMYFAAYKCQLCGATIMYGEPQDLPRETLQSLVDQFLKLQSNNSNPFRQKPPMFLPHKCKNVNGAGCAQFIGFMEKK